MCGRYANALSTETMRAFFQTAPRSPKWLESWNVAPTQPAPVIIHPPESGQRQLSLMRWGLVPSWAKDMTRAPINARAETVAENGMFRAPFRSRRCLVPATAWYEWRRQGRTKQPYAFARRDSRPLALAGIWDLWGLDGDVLRSFAIITTAATPTARTIHDRMPVTIEPEHFETWLTAPPAIAASLLCPPAERTLRVWSVGTRVNSPATNGPGLLAPLTAPGASDI